VCGIGTRWEIDPERLVPNPARSLQAGRWRRGRDAESTYFRQTLAARPSATILAGRAVVEAAQEHAGRDSLRRQGRRLRGVVKVLDRRYRETQSRRASEVEAFMAERPCPACAGLAPAAGVARAQDRRPLDRRRCALHHQGASGFFASLALSEREAAIARRSSRRSAERLGFLMNVGLDLPHAGPASRHAVGGEGQRIRLATQIGSSLVGVLYILDEPSIGLHQRDQSPPARHAAATARPSATRSSWSKQTRKRSAPPTTCSISGRGRESSAGISCLRHARRDGGHPHSLTGQYLSGARRIQVPVNRRQGNKQFITIHDPREHNLQGMAVKIPLGTFTCVTGVSGSGSPPSSTTSSIARWPRCSNRAQDRPGAHTRIEGAQHIDKVVDIDQSPIAARRARTRRPTRACSRSSGRCSRGRPRRACAATSRGASRSRQGRALRGVSG